MIKELFLAIVIGAILGLGLTGGYLTLNKKNQSKNTVKISQPTTIPTPTINITSDQNNDKQNTNKLFITSPEDNLLVSKESIDIIGSTIVKSKIIINTATKNFVGQSDDKGNFNVTIKLDTGLNIIKISSIDTEGNQLDTEINITYSTAKI
jgi:hypothetical protein